MHPACLTLPAACALLPSLYMPLSWQPSMTGFDSAYLPFPHALQTTGWLCYPSGQQALA